MRDSQICVCGVMSSSFWQNCLTHNNADAKRTLTFTWTAPNENVGPIHIGCVSLGNGPRESRVGEQVSGIFRKSECNVFSTVANRSRLSESLVAN